MEPRTRERSTRSGRAHPLAEHGRCLDAECRSSGRAQPRTAHGLADETVAQHVGAFALENHEKIDAIGRQPGQLSVREAPFGANARRPVEDEQRASASTIEQRRREAVQRLLPTQLAQAVEGGAERIQTERGAGVGGGELFAHEHARKRAKARASQRLGELEPREADLVV